MGRKKWVMAKVDKDAAVQISSDYDLDPFTSLLMTARGIKDDDSVLEFLSSDTDYCDPFELKDMKPAVQRIEKAVAAFERIAIYGDYDADGVTATALLYSYLESRGADVIFYIPERESDGYGLNRKAVDKLRELDVKLIITVDNGVSAYDEIVYGNSLGLEFVVTDHHHPPEQLPPAVAVVDPHREDCPSSFSDWSGVGVAFKLISAMEQCEVEELLPEYSPLAAIGTVADLVPLKGENRLLVSNGLQEINTDASMGIRALCEVAGLGNKKITSGHIAFVLSPRLNAAGRMGSAYKAVKLLLSRDEEECMALAMELDCLNRERQKTELAILADAETMIAAHPLWRYEPVLVVNGTGWHHGVVGIVAARLTEKYDKPCFVLSAEDGIARGSGRSIQGFSLYDALCTVADCLDVFGGHTLAAGLTMQEGKINEFRQRINAYADTIQGGMPFPVLQLDCKINPAYLSLDILESISYLEPFGAENPQPLFGLFQMVLKSITPVGNGKHLRLCFTKKDANVTAMLFSHTKEDFPYIPGDILDLAVKLDKNEYNGRVSVSVQIKDMRLHDADEDALFPSVRLYERFARGILLSAEEKQMLLPDRDAFAAVYRYIKKNQGWQYSLDVLCTRLNGMPYAKLGVILDAMEELGLISRRSGNIELCDVQQKVDLMASQVLCSIKA